MIQFNLLPDVKLAFVRAQRLKRIVILVSSVASGLSIALLIFFVVLVDIVQKHKISNLTSKINTDKSQVLNSPDLNKVLTVQNQLLTLPTLNFIRPVATNLVGGSNGNFGFIGQITPNNISLSDLNVDFNAKKLTVTGQSPTLGNVNTYVDTFKFTTYSTDGSSTTLPAFSSVTLGSFGRNAKGASFTISMVYDPNIFSNQHSVVLNVPSKITTRSVVDQPTDLFQKPVTQPTTGGQ